MLTFVRTKAMASACLTDPLVTVTLSWLAMSLEAVTVLMRFVPPLLKFNVSVFEIAIRHLYLFKHRTECGSLVHH